MGTCSPTQFQVLAIKPKEIDELDHMNEYSRLSNLSMSNHRASVVSAINPRRSLLFNDDSPQKIFSKEELFKPKQKLFSDLLDDNEKTKRGKSQVLSTKELHECGNKSPNNRDMYTKESSIEKPLKSALKVTTEMIGPSSKETVKYVRFNFGKEAVFNV